MINFWFAAYSSQFGIAIKVDNVTLAIQRLYRARAKEADPDLETLSIVRSPTDENEIWIIKRTPNAT